MKKLVFGLIAAFAGIFIFVGSVFAADVSWTVPVTGAEDIGTCNNVWASDNYDKVFNLTDNGNGTYSIHIVYKNGTFTTTGGSNPYGTLYGAPANASPGACESGSYNGNTVGAGITGTLTQTWDTVVQGILTGTCDAVTCTSASSSFNTLFGSGQWSYVTGWSEEGTYTTDHNGTWFDTWDNWPLNDTGDILDNVAYVNGGGHLLEEIGNKRKSWNDVSFGGWVSKLSDNSLLGDFQVVLHNVKGTNLDKTEFHGSDIYAMNLFNGDGETCNDAVNFTVNGMFNGSPASMIFRAGDFGSPNTLDTARVTLYSGQNGTGTVLYDTHWKDEFKDESGCVGTARTGLDTGNITIWHN